jgi:hypothetical protein
MTKIDLFVIQKRRMCFDFKTKKLFLYEISYFCGRLLINKVIIIVNIKITIINKKI